MRKLYSNIKIQNISENEVCYFLRNIWDGWILYRNAALWLQFTSSCLRIRVVKFGVSLAYFIIPLQVSHAANVSDLWLCINMDLSLTVVIYLTAYCFTVNVQRLWIWVWLNLEKSKGSLVVCIIIVSYIHLMSCIPEHVLNPIQKC